MLSVAIAVVAGDPHTAEDDDRDRHGYVDSHGHPPPELAGEGADEEPSERGADPHGDPDDGSEGAEGARPFESPEVLLDEAADLRCEQACSEAHEETADVEDRRVRRERGDGRGEAEDDHPGQEDPAAAEDVAGPAGRHHDDAQGERVPRERPLDRRVRGVQARLDRREGHVDDADRQEGHEQG